MRFGPILLLLGSLFVGMAQTPPLVQLRVQVLHAITRQPLDDVELRIVPANDQDQLGTLLHSDNRGQANAPLPPGVYIMTGSRHDLGFSFYGKLADDILKTIRVEAGKDPEPVEFLFAPLASMNGTVRDELGDPMPQTPVTLMRASWSGGRLQFASSFQATTDERGQYAMPQVAPGRYVVCAEPNPQSVRQVPVAGVVDFQTPPATRFYRRTCVPGGEARDAFAVGPGESVRRDLVLESAPAAAIRGRAIGSPNVSIRLRRANDGFGGRGLTVGANSQTGEFTLQGVSDGEYLLEAQGQEPTRTGVSSLTIGSVPLKVAGADLAVTVELEPRPTLKLEYEPESEKLVQNVTSFGFDQGSMGSTFQPGALAAASPGKAWLHHTTKGNTCVTGTMLDGKDVFRQVFTLSAGTDHRLAVRLSEQCGATLKVHAVSEGKHVPFARIAILLSGTPSEPGYVYVIHGDEEGRGEISFVAPGKYLVWAWPYDETERYVGPVDLASVAAQATEVEITPREAAPIDIPALRPEVPR